MVDTIQSHIGNFLTRSSDLHSAVAEVLTRTNPREIKDEMEARKEAMMQQRVDCEKLQSQAIELYSARKNLRA